MGNLEMLIPYASWTGTKINLTALRCSGWSLLMSPDTLKRCKGKTRPLWPNGKNAPYAIDNGAWGCFNSNRDFDAQAFEWTYKRIGFGAEFIVIPDIVEGGVDSLQFSLEWLPRLDGIGERRLIAVQDGMTANDVRPYLADNVGIFLGGSTEWKLETMPYWGKLARELGAYFHVGRVNTAKRIKMCGLCGADSFDGTSASRFSKTIRPLNNARNQLPLFEVI